MRKEYLREHAEERSSQTIEEREIGHIFLIDKRGHDRILLKENSCIEGNDLID